VPRRSPATGTSDLGSATGTRLDRSSRRSLAARRPARTRQLPSNLDPRGRSTRPRGTGRPARPRSPPPAAAIGMRIEATSGPLLRERASIGGPFRRGIASSTAIRSARGARRLEPIARSGRVLRRSPGLEDFSVRRAWPREGHRPARSDRIKRRGVRRRASGQALYFRTPRE
jgi:hypothetical protein